MEFIDSVITVLPFLIIFVFEFVPMVGSKIQPADRENKGRNTFSFLNVEEQLEESLREINTRNYELLDPNKLDYIIQGELRTRTDLEQDEFEELADDVPTTIQTQVPVSEKDIAEITKQHVSYLNDKIQSIVAGIATLISFMAVLYSRASGSPITLPDLLVYLAGPVLVFILFTIFYLRVWVNSPLEYRAVRDYLGFSPVSLVLVITNFGICVGILLLDYLAISYK